jgi:hypothetical protein
MRGKRRKPVKRTSKAIAIDWFLTILLILAVVVFVPMLFDMVR